MGSKSSRRDEALEELIEISRAIGGDPDLVQGGGGNTSVKTWDGRRLLVKASGTALADMDRQRGWAELDLEAARNLLGRPGLARLQAARREREVLRLLREMVIRPRGARPSVESSLHALLDRVVIHTHPAGLNALLCSRRSRERYREYVGHRHGEPLYVPYVDPGFTLAARVEREIERYRDRRGKLPAVVLLENHGLFVSTARVSSCLALCRAVCRQGRRFVGGRTNPRSFPVCARVSPREAGGGGRADASPDPARLRGALLRGGAAAGVLRRDGTSLARTFQARAGAVQLARRGAFTPDQIVYCRTFPLLLPPGRPERLAGAVAAYRKKHRLDPRVLIVPGRGVFYTAPDLSQLRIVSEVYRSAMAVLIHAGRAGGPRFLTRRQASFIEGWEVEAFRAKLVAGKSRPLTSRVALVADLGGGGDREVAEQLRERGATVFRLGSPGSEETDGSGGATISCRLDRERSVERAFETLVASAGGLDLLVVVLPGRAASPGGLGASLGEWRRTTGKWLEAGHGTIREAARVLERQGAGGEVHISGGRPELNGALGRLVEPDLRAIGVTVSTGAALP